MSNDLLLKELNFEIGKLQAQVNAMQQSMAELAQEIARLDLVIMSYGARIAALEAAQRPEKYNDITTADIKQAAGG